MIAPPGKPDQGPAERLLLVQMLRAMAASMVVVHHAQHDAEAVAAHLGLAFTRGDLLPWLSGVDIFFVISGFVMVHASANLFGRVGARRVFLTRRLIRIVPLYWIATTIYLAVALIAPRVLNSDAPSLWQIIASYLFIPFMRADGFVQPVYSLGWTLNFEMLFYFVFAAAIALPRRWAVAAASAGLALLVAGNRYLGPWPLPLGFWGDTIVLEFALGMGLALLRAQGLRLPGLLRLALIAAGFFLLHLDLSAADGGVVPQFLGYGIPAAFIVAAAVLGRETGRPPVFERFLVALGDASYALYLLHPFAIRALGQLEARTPLGALLGPWGFVALAYLAAVALALAAHRWGERPLLDRLRRLGSPAR
ncbi:acyltransferase family protein [Chelatococcus sp. GCM10030263]|uniref:acyltransferase family protein n=1 Tax=Chelatococcus sp. GCM10030263 TaxID=3273387 RepID=UPI00361A1462